MQLAYTLGECKQMRSRACEATFFFSTALRRLRQVEMTNSRANTHHLDVSGGVEGVVDAEAGGRLLHEHLRSKKGAVDSFG